MRWEAQVSLVSFDDWRAIATTLGAAIDRCQTVAEDQLKKIEIFPREVIRMPDGDIPIALTVREIAILMPIRLAHVSPLIANGGDFAADSTLSWDHHRPAAVQDTRGSSDPPV